jgi:hypothetical protein
LLPPWRLYRSADQGLDDEQPVPRKHEIAVGEKRIAGDLPRNHSEGAKVNEDDCRRAVQVAGEKVSGARPEAHYGICAGRIDLDVTLPPLAFVRLHTFEDKCLLFGNSSLPTGESLERPLVPRLWDENEYGLVGKTAKPRRTPLRRVPLLVRVESVPRRGWSSFGTRSSKEKGQRGYPKQESAHTTTQAA